MTCPPACELQHDAQWRPCQAPRQVASVVSRLGALNLRHDAADGPVAASTIVPTGITYQIASATIQTATPSVATTERQ